VDLPIIIDFFLRCLAGPFASNRSLGGPQLLRRSIIVDRIISFKENNEILVLIYEINET
jgi:hypothetical protein